MVGRGLLGLSCLPAPNLSILCTPVWCCVPEVVPKTTLTSRYSLILQAGVAGISAWFCGCVWQCRSSLLVQ